MRNLEQTTLDTEPAFDSVGHSNGTTAEAEVVLDVDEPALTAPPDWEGSADDTPRMAGNGGDIPPTDRPPTPTPSEDGPKRIPTMFKKELIDKLVGEVTVPARSRDQSEPQYDEREQIVVDTDAALKGLRDQQHTVAKKLGLDISQSEYDGWQPTEADVAKLRGELAPQRKRASMVEGAQTYIEDQVIEAAAEGIKLRPHQQDVATGFRGFMVNGERTTPQGGKSGLILQPTGTGKTRELVEVVAMMKHVQDPEEPNRVLVLTPTNTIQKQTVGADGKRGFGKFLPDMDVGRYDEDIKSQDRAAELAKETVVMCVPSFLELRRQGKMPHFDAVVVDEAHTVTGEKISKEIEDYCADKVSVGLTATAEYDEVRSARRLFKHLIAEMKLPEAVKGGLLAPVRGFLIDAQPVIDESKLPSDPVERKAAIREARYEARERAAVEIIKKELERGYQEVPGKDGIGIVVRCKPGDNVDYAFQFAKRLRGMYVKGPDGPMDLRQIMPGFVGGDASRQTKEVRDQILAAFDAKKINIVTNVKALGMGWDSEYPKVWIDLADGGEVDTIQGVGRELRLMRDDKGEIIKGPDGKPIEAHVYSFVNQERGDKQYNVLNVLGTKSGEVLEYDERHEAPIPKPRQRSERYTPPRVEVTDVITSTVGSLALEGEVSLAPEGAPIATPMDREQACATLGVSRITYNQIMKNLGSDPTEPISPGDFSTVLDLYPALRPASLPVEGYTSAASVAAEISENLRPFAVMRFARSSGIAPQRFTSPEGRVGFYFESSTAERLRDLLRQQLGK